MCRARVLRAAAMALSGPLNRYLLLMAQEHLEFRLPEIKSLLSLFGGQFTSSQESYGKSPFWILTIPSEDIARNVMKRTVCAKSVFELWGHGKSPEELYSSLRSYPVEKMTPFLRSDSTYKIQIHTFNKTLTQEEKIQRIDALEFLPFEGKVNLKKPQHIFSILEDYGLDPNSIPETPHNIYFGRWIADGQRELIESYSVKKRHFIGNTSMDAGLSFIMANHGKVKENDIVFDPFVGTGSTQPIEVLEYLARVLAGDYSLQYGASTHIPVCSVDSQIVELLRINSRNVSFVLGAADDTEASCCSGTLNWYSKLINQMDKVLFKEAQENFSVPLTTSLLGGLLIASAHFGAYVYGTDIDYNTIHGLGKASRKNQKWRGPDENIRANLRQYGLEKYYLDVLISDASKPSWRKGTYFDAIITDPPYGIRESTRRTGSQKEIAKGIEKCPESHVPVSLSYHLSDMFFDLLNFAAETLVLGGRLVYWLPVYTPEYTEEMIPWHPCLEIISNCEQKLSSHTSRRLITMEKVKLFENRDHYLRLLSDQILLYHGHDSFREKYFSGITKRITKEEKSSQE